MHLTPGVVYNSPKAVGVHKKIPDSIGVWA